MTSRLISISSDTSEVHSLQVIQEDAFVSPATIYQDEAESLKNRGLRDTWLIRPSSSTEAERHEQSQERTSDSRRVICNDVRDGFYIAF